MELEELHIKYSATAIYQCFTILEKHKNDLLSHLKDVDRILEMALKETWKFDYPEHVDGFKNLRIFMIDELAKEITFTKNLADVTHNLNKTIEIFKRL